MTDYIGRTFTVLEAAKEKALWDTLRTGAIDIAFDWGDGTYGRAYGVSVFADDPDDYWVGADPRWKLIHHMSGDDLLYVQERTDPLDDIERLEFGIMTEDQFMAKLQRQQEATVKFRHATVYDYNRPGVIAFKVDGLSQETLNALSAFASRGDRLSITLIPE